MDWTNEQQKVLDAKGNIIVSAAAGSGKTAVLTQRITDKVYAGTSIERMLVVTFTTAAAAEMKQRITKNIEEAAEKETDVRKKKYMNAQAAAVQRANISTIDSFCAYLFSRHFYEFGMSQATHVGDDTLLFELKEKALSDTLSEYFETHGSELYDVFGGEEGLEKLLSELLKKMRTYPDGRAWLHRAVEEYGKDPDDVLTSELFARKLEGIKRQLRTAQKALKDSYDFTDGLDDKQLGLLNHKESVVKRALDSKNVIDMKRAIDEGFSTDNAKSVSRKADENYKVLNKQALDLYNAAKKELDGLFSEAEYLPVQYVYAKQIEELILTFDDKLREEKRKRAVIDFTDLEIFAYRLLSDEKNAEVYRKHFDFIFVDEYQDTSPLQDEIIKRLMSDENETFFVGDVKQSIYRFRDAEPKLFINKLKEYERGENSQRLDLTENFRSTRAVVDFTNDVFGSIMTERTGGIDYDEKSRLKKHDEAKEGSFRFHVIDKTKQKDDGTPAQDDVQTGELDETLEEITHVTAEARLVAKEIQYLLGTEFYDGKKKETRRFTYSDIAILMRKVKGNAEFFIRELVSAGIPVMAATEDSFFNSLEAEVFLNLLRVTDNRRQDIPLLSVMRSPIGNFTMEEIAQMRVDVRTAKLSKDTDMLDTVVYAAKSGSKKAADFLARLEKWHTISLTEPLGDFIQFLLIETGFYRFVSVLPGGDVRCSNLERIVQLAQERKELFGLSEFLKYLDKAQNAPSSSGRDAVSVNNAVSLMTIHKSKGLEYNAVIVPNLGTKVVLHDPASDSFIANSDHLGLRMTIDGRDTKSLYFIANAEEERAQLRCDLMRLLYVAFTRARDTLVLIGADDKIADRIAKNEVRGDIEDHVSDCTKQTDLIYTAMNLSGHGDALKKALESGIARDGDYTFTVTKLTDFYLPEQEIDKSYFIDELGKIRGIDTTEIESDAAWVYPHIGEARLVSKGSVTGFAEVLTDVRIGAYHSETRGNTGVSAAARGSATHLVFEKIPLEDHDENSVREFIEKLVKENLLSREDADSIDVKKVAAFFKRPIYQRMKKSPRLLREQEFTCFCDASLLIKGTNSKEQILLQGKIDCCFIEAGKWVLLDYKTDSVNPDDADAVQQKADSHREQLRLYAYVLKKITHIPVKECIISFTNAYECTVTI